MQPSINDVFTLLYHIEIYHIVSFIGSTTYELSRYFNKVLAPLVGNTEHHIRNTYDWVGKSRQFQLDNDEDVVSFDVVESLYIYIY